MVFPFDRKISGCATALPAALRVAEEDGTSSPAPVRGWRRRWRFARAG